MNSQTERDTGRGLGRGHGALTLPAAPTQHLQVFTTWELPGAVWAFKETSLLSMIGQHQPLVTEPSFQPPPGSEGHWNLQHLITWPGNQPLFLCAFQNHLINMNSGVVERGLCKYETALSLRKSQKF